MKIYLTIALLFFVIFVLNVQAQELPRPTVRVDHIATMADKLKERTILILKLSKQAKADYYQYLAEKRLAELAYVIENKNIDLVEEVASRYSTYIGILTNYVVANSIAAKNKDLISMFDKHTQIIFNLQKSFRFESGWWLAIQHDLNSLKLFRNTLK